MAVLGFKFLHHQSDFRASFMSSSSSSQVSLPAEGASTSRKISTSKLGANKSLAIAPPEPVPSLIPPSTGESAEFSELPPATPRSLYVLAATLLAMEVMDLEDLLPYLSPSFSDTVRVEFERETASRKTIQRLGFVNLKENKAGKDADEAAEKMGSTAMGSESLADGNQVLGLLAGLFSLRLWDSALQLIAWIREGVSAETSDFSFDPMGVPAIREELTNLILWYIRSNSSSSNSGVGFVKYKLAGPPSKSYDGGENHLFDVNISPSLGAQQLDCHKAENNASLLSDPCLQSMLTLLGHRIGLSPLLFTKVSRLVSAEFKAIPNNDISEETYPIHLLRTALLPGLTLSSCNAAVAFALWEPLSLLPFQARFPLYADWRGDAMGKAAAIAGCKSCDLAEAEELTLISAKTFLKRLAKENVKSVGRLIGKQTHAFPLIVFHHILSQIEAYDNLIPYVVDALKYSTLLAKDVLAYALLAQVK